MADGHELAHSIQRASEAVALQLRPYQLEAVEAIIGARKRGLRRLLIALPTGAGKTIIFSELIRRAKHQVLVLAHRQELLMQARDKIRRALDQSGQTHRLVAIEGGQQRARKDASVLVASLRSLHQERLGQLLAGRDIRLVIYDECHHAVAEDNQRILRQLGAFESDWPGTLVGVTATTRRADGRGLQEVFEKIVYSRTLREMIADGYLRPLRGIRIQTGIELSQVSLQRAPGGRPFPPCSTDTPLPERVTDRDTDRVTDLESLWEAEFDPDELEATINVESRNLLVARSIHELTRDRRTIAFCVGVCHAENLCRQLNELGVRSGMICGEMPTDQRQQTLARFREGRLQVITNVGVLTEGFDDPGVSAIAMVRPTRSESIYLQCIGRGMRLGEAASDCLVLDFVDLSKLSIVELPTLLAEPKQQYPQPDPEENTGPPFRQPLADNDEPEEALTLSQLRDRLAAFDPLTLGLQHEVAAISANAWLSLGKRGLLLHFVNHEERLDHFEVRPRQGRKSGYDILLGDRTLTRTATVDEAVSAVDHELMNYGDPDSAKSNASWRAHPVHHELAETLAALKPPRVAGDAGEAIEILALALAMDDANPRRS